MGLMYPKIHGLLSNLGVDCSSFNYATNLYGLYEFENNGNLGEDTAGSLDFTNINGVTQVPGKIGFASQANKASSQGFEQPYTATEFDLTQANQTWSLWFRISEKTGSGNQNTFVRIIEPGSFQTRFAMYMNDSDRLVGEWRDQTSGDRCRLRWDTFPFMLNTWYHFVLVSDNRNPIMYLNGVSVGSQTGSVTSVPVSLLQAGTDVMRMFFGSTAYFSGNLDQFAIWQRALSPDEVTCLYNSGSGRFIP